MIKEGIYCGHFWTGHRMMVHEAPDARSGGKGANVGPIRTVAVMSPRDFLEAIRKGWTPLEQVRPTELGDELKAALEAKRFHFDGKATAVPVRIVASPDGDHVITDSPAEGGVTASPALRRAAAETAAVAAGAPAKKC